MAPDFLARCRIQRHDDRTASGQVKPSLDKYRVSLKREWFPVAFPELTGAVAPDFLKSINIVAGYLRQAGVLHAMLTAAIVVPLHSIIGLSDDGYRTRDQHCNYQTDDDLNHRWIFHGRYVSGNERCGQQKRRFSTPTLPSPRHLLG